MIKMHPVVSSNVSSVGRDGDDLLVKFRSGTTYRYKGAGSHLQRMLQANSVGRYLNEHIKKEQYPYVVEA